MTIEQMLEQAQSTDWRAKHKMAAAIQERLAQIEPRFLALREELSTCPCCPRKGPICLIDWLRVPGGDIYHPQIDEDTLSTFLENLGEDTMPDMPQFRRAILRDDVISEEQLQRMAKWMKEAQALRLRHDDQRK